MPDSAAASGPRPRPIDPCWPLQMFPEREEGGRWQPRCEATNFDHEVLRVEDNSEW